MGRLGGTGLERPCKRGVFFFYGGHGGGHRVYTHALVDYREVDRAKLLTRVDAVPAPVPPAEEENVPFAGAF